jgi:hypothetical protein
MTALALLGPTLTLVDSVTCVVFDAYTVSCAYTVFVIRRYITRCVQLQRVSRLRCKHHCLMALMVSSSLLLMHHCLMALMVSSSLLLIMYQSDYKLQW